MPKLTSCGDSINILNQNLCVPRGLPEGGGFNSHIIQSDKME